MRWNIKQGVVCFACNWRQHYTVKRRLLKKVGNFSPLQTKKTRPSCSIQNWIWSWADSQQRGSRAVWLTKAAQLIITKPVRPDGEYSDFTELRKKLNTTSLYDVPSHYHANLPQLWPTVRNWRSCTSVVFDWRDATQSWNMKPQTRKCPAKMPNLTY